MTQWNSTRDRAVHHRKHLAGGPQLMLAVFVLATVVGLGALVSLAAPASILPLASLTAIAGAAVVALGAWWTNAERRPGKIDGWDLAGALAFIGFAAGMLTETEQLLQFFGHRTIPR